MAVTLNATVSNGLVISPDNSGQIQFQLNGVNVPSPSVAPAFSASGAQTVTTTTTTKSILNTKQFDTNNNFDATTNYRFQPTVAGYYQLNLNIQAAAASASGGIVSGNIYKNGANINNPNFIEFLDSNLTGLGSNGSLLVYANGSTDYFEAYIFQSSGANQTIYTYFNGFLARTA